MQASIQSYDQAWLVYSRFFDIEVTVYFFMEVTDQSIDIPTSTFYMLLWLLLYRTNYYTIIHLYT